MGEQDGESEDDRVVGKPPTLLQLHCSGVGGELSSRKLLLGLVLCGSCQVWLFLPDPFLPHTGTHKPCCCSSSRSLLPLPDPTPGCKDKSPGSWSGLTGPNKEHWGAQDDTETALGQSLLLPCGQLLWFFLRAHFLPLFSMWFMSSCNTPAPGTPSGLSGDPSLCLPGAGRDLMSPGQSWCSDVPCAGGRGWTAPSPAQSSCTIPPLGVTCHKKVPAEMFPEELT